MGTAHSTLGRVGRIGLLLAGSTIVGGCYCLPPPHPHHPHRHGHHIGPAAGGWAHGSLADETPADGGGRRRRY